MDENNNFQNLRKNISEIRSKNQFPVTLRETGLQFHYK